MALRLGLPSLTLYPPTKFRVLSCRSHVYAHSQSPQLTIVRRSAKYKPTIWHDNFIQSLSSGEKLGQIGKAKRVCDLKKEVSKMIYKRESLKDKLELIDALQQLGVAYHFKEEINYVLSTIYNKSKSQDLLLTVNDDLYLVSLLFRLLRTNGFSVQEDIFRNFFDENGDCKPKISSDIKGMLSLYEASYFAKGGEEMLEMARHYTTKHVTKYLESSTYIDPRIKEHISHALELPLNWRMERLHTRWFIDQYKTGKQIRHALWELAILDFNLNQNLYKEELKHVSSWWTRLRLYENLPFIRDRLVENYLSCVGGAFEPEHYHYRIAQTQVNCLLTTVDDVYDVYGSLNELEAFTKAIEQWDITAIEALPEYMQLCLSALFENVENHSYGVFKRKGLNVSPILRRAWKDFCTASLVEARRYHMGYVPTLEEYIDNGCFSVAAHVIISYAYCINDDVTAKNLEQFSSGYPDIVRYSSLICRLYNDLATSNDELKRGDTKGSMIQCYMQQKKVTELVARQEIKNMIWKYWTKLNGEVFGCSDFHKFFRDVALDVPRISQFLYQHDDGYGKPDHETKDKVTLLLLEPIK